MARNDVIDFIFRRFPVDCNWTNGNCLWFAFILNKRFPELRIVYDQIDGYFMVQDEGGVLYDFRGVVDDRPDVIGFDELKDEDPLLYDRLIRDCMM